MKNTDIKIFENEDIGKYLSFGIGGKVKYLVEAKNQNEIISAIKLANKKKIPYIILGGGHNVVFPDKKWNGLVIKISGGNIKKSGNNIYCDAGDLLLRLIEIAVENGLSGIETLSGIPGTVGGAIYGNAGAYGHSISEFLSSVTLFDGKDIKTISKDKCDFSYRESIFKKRKWVILGAEFHFMPGDRDSLIKISKKIIDIRWNKFGKEPRCAGSYFKNVLIADLKPEIISKIDPKKMIEGKIPAGYLLESVGAKGMRIGGIYVSDYHGNVILNDGEGSYADLIKLTQRLKKLVKDKFNITIEEEVVIVD